jgi:hypothetical protein
MLTVSIGKRVFGHLVGQELQGNKSVQLYVFGLVNHTHASAAQLLDDAVGDGLSEHRRNAMAYGFGSQRWWIVEVAQLLLRTDCLRLQFRTGEYAGMTWDRLTVAFTFEQFFTPFLL